MQLVTFKKLYLKINYFVLFISAAIIGFILINLIAHLVGVYYFHYYKILCLIRNPEGFSSLIIEIGLSCVFGSAALFLKDELKRC